MVTELTDQEQAILAFEARWTRHSGAKEQAIRAELALAPARYYQLLGRLIDTEPAMVFDPLLVGRLRRRRERDADRRQARS